MTLDTASGSGESCQRPLDILPTLLTVPTITSVKQPASFDYYGPFKSSFIAAATDFIVTHTDAQSEPVSCCLNSFMESTQSNCVGNESGKAACWLTIRLFQPSDEFKIPRWHQDGRMYPYDVGREDLVRSKYGVTLLGPHTLMLPSSPHILSTLAKSRSQFYFWRDKDGKKIMDITEQERDEADDKMRAWLAEQYKAEPRIKLRQGEVVRFSWGREDSPVHSEPDFICDRIFMTILYGSEKEMQGMCEWRNETYGEPSIFQRRV